MSTDLADNVNGLSSRENSPQPLTIVEEENCAAECSSIASGGGKEGSVESFTVEVKVEEEGAPAAISTIEQIEDTVSEKTMEIDDESVLARLAPAETTVTRTVSSRTSSSSSRNSSPDCKGRKPFDWPAYLEETGAEAAPQKCFFQNQTPPVNLFSEGDKIETNDPRSPEQLCLATVVSVYKVWIQVRLDGCDDTYDFWLLSDDTNLHPVGYGPSKGKNVVPPVGTQKNMDRWLVFLDKQISEASRAPPEAFSPVDQSCHPKKNRFKVGEKLEAIDTDPGQFVGKVSPATVVAVKGQNIVIQFDGWSKAYNKTVRYDSRNIFPVQWAAKGGVDLLRSPKMKVSPKSVVKKEKVENQPATSHRKRDRKSDKVVAKAKKREAIETPVSDLKQKRKRSTPTRLQVSDELDDEGPLVVPKIKIMPPPNQLADALHLGSNGARAKKSTMSSTPVVGVKIKKEPIVNLGSLHEFGETVISPHPVGKQANELALCVYLQPHCACGSHLDPNLLSKYSPTCIGPANLNQVMRQCVQLLLDCALHTQVVLSNVETGNSKLTVTADVDGKTLVVKSLPLFQQTQEVKQYLDRLLTNLGVCTAVFSYKDEPCYTCNGRGKGYKERKRSRSANSDNSYNSRMSSSTDREGPQQGKSAENWTKEEVVQYLYSETKDKNIADSFAQADMDGKALLMLTPELMIKHMDIRLGPALRLHGIISKLKGMTIN